jgi:hypothetical protein
MFFGFFVLTILSISYSFRMRVQEFKQSCQQINSNAIRAPDISRLTGNWYEVLQTKNSQEPGKECSMYQINQQGRGIQMYQGYIKPDGTEGLIDHELRPTNKANVFVFTCDTFLNQGFAFFDTDYTTFLIMVRCDLKKTPHLTVYAKDPKLAHEISKTVQGIVQGKLGMNTDEFISRDKKCGKSRDTTILELLKRNANPNKVEGHSQDAPSGEIPFDEATSGEDLSGEAPKSRQTSSGEFALGSGSSLFDSSQTHESFAFGSMQ